MPDQTPQPEFNIDDAALLIGRMAIENHVLRKGLESLRKEQEDLKQKVATMMQSRPGPTLAIVQPAGETDASAPGET